MPARARRKTINAEEYARLIAASLPIPPRTEAENERLIALLAALDEREDLTPAEGAFSELLAIVIEDFEEKHYALPKVTPQQSLKAFMEDRGLRHKDIAPVVGNKGSHNGNSERAPQHQRRAGQTANRSPARAD